MPAIALRPISNAERQAIRRYYTDTNPKPRQKDIITWFQHQYGRKLAQATISNSLKDRYKHLNTPTTANPTSYRQREGR